MAKYITIAVILITFFGVIYFGGQKIQSLKTDIQELSLTLENEKEKNRIKISKTMLSSVSKFTFLEVKSSFSYLYDDNIGSGVKYEKVTALFEWEYVFSFGFDVPKDWDWCPKIVDGENGVVSVNAPPVTQTNSNLPAPSKTKVLNGAYWDAHEVEIENTVKQLAQERIKEVAESYLENATTQQSVRDSLSNHLKTIMNAGHSNSNPIRTVKVIFGKTCE